MPLEDTNVFSMMVSDTDVEVYLLLLLLVIVSDELSVTETNVHNYMCMLCTIHIY